MVLSYHAQKRAKNRSIPEDAVDICTAWGRSFLQPGDYEVFFVGKKEVQAAAKQGVDLTNYENLAIVIGEDETVVTIMWVNDPKKLRFEKQKHQRRRAPGEFRRLN